MAIFWPCSLFMDRWKSYCTVPLMLCVSKPPAEFDQIAVVARPLQAVTRTERSEAIWKAALANRDTINKEGKTFCVLFFWIFLCQIAHFPSRIMLGDTCPGLRWGRSRQQYRLLVLLWSQDHVRHEAVLSMPAGSHSLSFRCFPALAERTLLPFSFFFLFHGHKCILLLELLCLHINYHKKKKKHSQKWWKNMLVFFVSICLTRRQRGLMWMSTFCMLELFPMNLSNLSCFGWPSWVSVGPQWYLDSTFFKITLEFIVVIHEKKKRGGAPLKI